MSGGIDNFLDEVDTHLRCTLARFDEVTESPIEALFLFYLVTFVRVFKTGDSRAVICGLDIFSDAEIRYEDVVIVTQHQIGKFRVDFLISAGPNPSKKLVVECDGHDFHERTKEQAASDRSRDRALQSAGYEVFRFTGSELWHKPSGCVEEVLRWACKQREHDNSREIRREEAREERRIAGLPAAQAIARQ